MVRSPSATSCGHHDLLVVTGPERGNMWIDVRAGDEGIAPLVNETLLGRRQTFLEWYQAWLAEAMRKCQTH